MDLKQLKIFQMVVEEGSITGAANKLHRVQSNVTTRIRQLEQQLAVELFIRDGKRLHLSPAGKVLLGYANKLLALADEAKQAVQNQEPQGIFRLGSMESTAAVRLPRVLTHFHREFPVVDIQLRTGNPLQLTNAILAGEIDAAFVAEPIAEAQFEQIPAFEEELVLVSSTDYKPTRPDEALPDTIIAFESGCPHRQRLENLYFSRQDRPAHTIQLSSYHAMLACVIVGMGVALLPKSVLTTFPEHQRLGIHPLPDGVNKATTLLAWRRGASSPNINALITMLEN